MFAFPVASVNPGALLDVGAPLMAMIAIYETAMRHWSFAARGQRRE
jgi:hypothetical protein